MNDRTTISAVLPQYVVDEYLEFPPGLDGTPAALANAESQREFDKRAHADSGQLVSVVPSRRHLHEVAKENLEHQALFYVYQHGIGILDRERAEKFRQSVSATLAAYPAHEQEWLVTYVLRRLEDILDTRTGA